MKNPTLAIIGGWTTGAALLVALALFAAIIGTVAALSQDARAATGDAPPGVPEESRTFRKFAALATPIEKADFLASARFVQANANCLQNVATALERNEVADVPGIVYTADQVTSIQNAGLACAWRLKEGYLSALAIANVTPAQLDSFAVSNASIVGPLPGYCTLGETSKCPAE